jgi:ABC-type transport system involved in multi-copper enzyme maturation permease subunit
MLKCELKRILTKRLNRVLITIGLALSMILSFLAATSNRFVTPQGYLETGITATRKLVKDKNRNKGLMTPQRISNLIAQDQKTFREYKDKNESDKVYGRSLQQYLDVEQLVSYILTGNEDYNPSVYLDVNPKKLLNIYKIRDQKIQKLIRQNGKTKEQRQYLKAQYAKISTPYDYEAPDSWDTLQLYVVTYSIILAVLMGVLASGIFAEEITLKADAVFFSSKYGRNKAIKSKIIAGLITSTGIYWIGMCLFTVISLSLMGTSGSHTLMSVLNSYTIYNVTYGQAFYIMMFAGYVANLLATTISMLVSALMGSPNIAICIPFFLFCIMPFIGRIGGSKGIFLLTPDQLNNFQEIIRDNHIYQIGGFVTNQISMILTIYVFVVIAILPCIYLVYKKK